MPEPEHEKRLRINRVFIVNNLVGVNEILDHLFNEEVFSKAVVDFISHAKEESEKIRLILDYLHKKSSDNFDKFCSILDKTGNELTAAKLRNSAFASSSVDRVTLPQKGHGLMTDKDRKIFQRLHVKFVEYMLDVESVVDSLMSQELINRHHRSFIFKDSERRQQVRNLMSILPKKGNAALPGLLRALDSSGNDYLHKQVLDYKKEET